MDNVCKDRTRALGLRYCKLGSDADGRELSPLEPIKVPGLYAQELFESVVSWQGSAHGTEPLQHPSGAQRSHEDHTRARAGIYELDIRRSRGYRRVRTKPLAGGHLPGALELCDQALQLL